MNTNFINVANKAIKEIHELNLETTNDFNISYTECFPVYVSKKFNIDDKNYYMSIEVKIKEVQ